MAVHAGEIAQIEQLEQFERPRADNVKFHVNLQTLARSEDVREAGFAVQAKPQDAPGHSHRGFGGFERRCVSRRILFNELRRGRCPVEAMRVCVMAASFDLGKLFLALKILVLRLKR